MVLSAGRRPVRSGPAASRAKCPAQSGLPSSSTDLLRHATNGGALSAEELPPAAWRRMIERRPETRSDRLEHPRPVAEGWQDDQRQFGGGSWSFGEPMSTARQAAGIGRLHHGLW